MFFLWNFGEIWLRFWWDFDETVTIGKKWAEHFELAAPVVQDGAGHDCDVKPSKVWKPAGTFVCTVEDGGNPYTFAENMVEFWF